MDFKYCVISVAYTNIIIVIAKCGLISTRFRSRIVSDYGDSCIRYLNKFTIENHIFNSNTLEP